MAKTKVAANNTAGKQAAPKQAPAKPEKAAATRFPGFLCEAVGVPFPSP